MNAKTYAERLSSDMNRGIAITDMLEEILISENGKIDNFQKVAENQMTDFIQSIQIAPKGVVTDIYPEAGNEARKINLIHDESRGEICRYGRDHNITTMQGPFDLKQGGKGIAIRNPVYLDNEDGKSVFWGFSIVIIRVPDIFADSVQALTDFGYDYCLSKTVSPQSEEYEEVYSSRESLENPVTICVGVQMDIDDLIRHADLALYEVKLQGKHNCLAYRGDYRTQHRSRLGFALQDVSKNLPGAFLIYIADPQNDQILFANRELIEFSGCSDFDDFLDYTDHSFRNLIRPDEQNAVETSIWSQINSQTSRNNDYVKFHFAKKDGTYRPVLDHGRIVKNRYYGNVFYVLIMDCALVEPYYDEK